MLAHRWSREGKRDFFWERKKGKWNSKEIKDCDLSV